MIQQSIPKTPQWQRELQDAVRQPDELFSLLGLDSQELNFSAEASKQFPLRVPRSFVDRMRQGDWNDPLLRQVLPINQELIPVTGYSNDPVADTSNLAAPGVIHKYKTRALLITTGACAVHCRYCFRRHYPYQEEHAGKQNLDPALRYIEEHSELNEILLSGGDPLSLPDAKIQQLSHALYDIPHIKRLRIHTRQPVVLPSRVTQGLLNAISIWGNNAVIVLHVNHANEINDDLRAAITQLKSTGATLLNQAVLLKGVNDSVAAQVNLSETLFSAGVLPYYLNLLDKVEGAAHFDIDEPTALKLYRTVQKHLSGYLLPRLVRDHGGNDSKSLIV
jgi:EF-P beta-lysylation protein EpmB